MRDKKILVLIFVFVILVCILGTIYPVTAVCISDDTIMKLYQPMNSHGALWNETGYSYDICYSDIFHSLYTEANPHTCTGTNKVVGLFQVNNSHAEIPLKSAYSHAVCYGNLVCRAVSEIEGAVAFYKFEGYPNDASGNGNNGNVYGATLTTGKINQAYSFNGIDNYITIPDSSSLDLSREFTFSAWIFRRTDANEYERIISKSDINDYDYWFQINPDDKLQVGVKKSDGNLFYLNGSVVPLNIWTHITGVKDSTGFYIYVNGILTASGSSWGTAGNARITTNPFNIGRLGAGGGWNYKFNGIIDEVKVWNRALSASEILNEANSNNPNTNCASDESIVVRLFQENNSHISNASDLNYPIKICCKPTTDITQNGKYVFANISKPDFDSHITGTQVEFNATTSFAINVTASPLSIECLGGLCPNEIQYSLTTVTISDPNNKRGNFSSLIFAWKFDDGDSSCDGVVNKKNCTAFKKIFSIPGQHFVNLSVFLASGENGTTFTKFTLGNVCLDGGETWWDSSGISHNTSAEGEEYCKGLDGIAGNSDDCCPVNYNCTAGAAGIGGCKLVTTPATNITACSDYKDSTNCSNDPQRVGVAGGGGVGTERCGKTENVDDTTCTGITITGTTSSCKCEWNNGACKLKLNMTSSIFGDIPFINTCFTSSSAEECIDESMKVHETSTIEWDNSTINGLINKIPPIPGVNDSASAIAWLNATCNLNDLCPNEERFVVCGADLTKLGFFSWMNLIFAFIIIVIIYVGWSYMKRKRNKKRMKRWKKK